MLPVETVLEDVRDALRSPGAAVLQAAPGAGKTTVVPPALLAEKWLGGRRILVLEPRRLAARAAAHRMAFLRGEQAGHSIGYRTRLDSRVGALTRVEVVTEGILTRMVQDDPTLDGIGLVIFDEFHERSLQADTGLALVLHTRRLVRPDLRILVMSATLDGAAVTRLLGDARVIAVEGREYAVETRYRVPNTPRNRAHGPDIAFTAVVVREALAASRGDVLVFLPGAPEIHRLHGALAGTSLPPEVDVHLLHGSLLPSDQDSAIAPAPPGRRKVVLATSIAETSLTIEGVRVVVDTGFARVSRFSPRTGMSRLETLRVSRASADQRRGRAGRTAPGLCYRLWSQDDEAAFLAHSRPEILEGDLVPLALDLAAAGVVDPLQLDWLDLPPPAALSQARELLSQLEAIDDSGRLTTHGRAMAGFGMHPRLAHMILRAATSGSARLACELASLLGERDPLRADVAAFGSDIRARLDALHHPRDYSAADRGVLHRVGEQAKLWRSRLPAGGSHRDEPDAAGRVLALAFPDRVAQRRPGPAPRYLLRNGTGAILPEGDPLGAADFVVIAESDGRSPEARVFLATAVSPDDIVADFGAQVTEVPVVEWDIDHGIRATAERRLGQIVLSRSTLRDPNPGLVAAAVSGAIRRRGLEVLPWNDGARRLRQRLAFLHAHDGRWPDMSDAALHESLVVRLGDSLGRVRSSAELRRIDLVTPLLDLVDWTLRPHLDRLAPTHYEAPTGTRVSIDYSDPDAPAASLRLQELFGVRETPAVLGGRVALTLNLLSPAQRPVQTTRDLAGFWRNSYFDVRKELRARYPRHSWPEDPASAAPTSRARPRR